jgi:hypothetical protein
MRNTIQRWLTLTLFAGLVLAGPGVAQPPGPKDGPPKGPTPLTPLGVDDVVERIMSFDKDRKGKVTRDDLPDRMQFLIELGDTNKDGALDKDEVRKLATKLAATPGGFGEGGTTRFGPGPGPGPGAPGGFGIGGAFRSGPDAIEGVVEDLRLSGKKKEQAMAAVKAHQENVRKLMDQARADLLEKMKEVLSEEEFKDFRAALDRPRGETFFVGPRDAPREGGQKKPDQPEK